MRRRRALPLENGERILVDLTEPATLGQGDRLVLEDGRQVEIVAAEEEVLEVRAGDAVHLAELAWHVGNRHLAAAIFADRILIRFPVEAISVKAAKPEPPIALTVEEVSVEVWRERTARHDEADED